MINEPKGMSVAEVDDLNERILGIIRVSNPTRNVIYSGNMYSNSEQLLQAAIPNDDYIIAYYHAYDPWRFSGQSMGTWGTANDYQQVTNKYNTVKNWSVANNIPVHHSEFGAMVNADFNSRMRIYAHNVEQCMINGFAFSVWDDGGDFKILNRSNNTWPEVKDILVHYYQDSPNQIFSTFTPDSGNDVPAIVVDWNNRATDNGNFIVERSLGASSNFEQIADLPADATSYIDQDIEGGMTYTYRMFTTRTDGTLLHGYPTRIRITATAQTPFNQSAIDIPGLLKVEEYDNGGEGLAYHDEDEVNLAGGFRIDEGVDIGVFGSGYILGYVEENEWIEYTVDVAESGTYSVAATLASEVSNGTFSITFDKNNSSTNFTAPNTGDWNTFQRISANNEIELEAGIQQMRLLITNGNPFNVNNFTFSLLSVGVDEVDAVEAGFMVSPNPSNGAINVELTNALHSKNLHLELFSITGEKLNNFQIDEANTSLDLSNYSSGLYILKLVGDNVDLIHRIVIQ